MAPESSFRTHSRSLVLINSSVRKTLHKSTVNWNDPATAPSRSNPAPETLPPPAPYDPLRPPRDPDRQARQRAELIGTRSFGSRAGFAAALPLRDNRVVHFSAIERRFADPRWPKTWTCPFRSARRAVPVNGYDFFVAWGIDCSPRGSKITSYRFLTHWVRGAFPPHAGYALHVTQ